MITRIAIAALSLVAAAGVAQAQDASSYPNRPINFIVPFGPGGSSDVLARVMGRVAAKYLGQPFVVINRPGGAMRIGLNEVVEAKPDGYTIGTANPGIAKPPTGTSTRDDFIRQLEPLGQVANIPYVMAVGAQLGVTTLEEFVAYAKANPGRVKYGTAAAGGTTHSSFAMFGKMADVQIEPVHFDGGTRAIAAMLGGHVQAAWQSPSDFRPQVMAGKIRVLAVAGDQRISGDPVYKDVPTFKEKGFDVVDPLWQGVAGPKGLPAEVRTKLVDGLRKIIEDPETQKAVQDAGLLPEYLGPEAFQEKWNAQQATMKRNLIETGIIAAQ
jgi:tripartite-type tricarboxylate transporter receptor subunit TctC